MQGFNMGRYNPPAALDRSLSSKLVAGFNEGTNRALKTTVRFEMPFDIWCTTCQPEAVIPQGVRFNAHKETVGKYYSTPIFGFRMKHGACGGIIEIRTDPENREYAVHEGGRRKAIPREDNDGFFGEILTEEERKRRQDDAFAHIEGRTTGQEAEQGIKDEIKLLRRERAKFWHDPHATNSNLRRTFRVERKAIEAANDEKAALAEKFSLGIELLDQSKSDSEIASKLKFGDRDQAGKDRFWAVNRPIFSSTTRSTSTEATSHGSRQARAQKGSVQRDLFHKVKRTERLHRDPWSDFYLSQPKSESSLSTLKRKRKRSVSPQRSRNSDMGIEPGDQKPKQAGVLETSGVALVDYGSDSDD